MDNYPNKLLTEICELLMEHDLPLQHVKNLAADLAGEYDHMVKARAEPDDTAYRRDMIAAGRGHLLR